ncbi:MAG: sodium:calcium antiporter [Streptosporangiaceae bacterium]
MSVGLTALLFVAALALTVISSLVLAEVVDRLGERFGLSEGLLGIVTALAADSPEIAAAVTAIQQGKTGVGLGVVFGSNLFNIAALLGLSAAVAGKVRIRRRALIFQGGVALAVTAVVSALVLRWVAPVTALAVVLVIFVPYAGLSALRPRQVEQALRPGRPRSFLVAALSSVEKDVRPAQTAPRATRHDLYTLVPALTAVVLGSIGMVNTSLALGRRWGISEIVIGTVVLASLTGLPNVLASVRLARQGRGSAVVSESFNSNTLNLLVGVTLPALIGGVAAPAASTLLTVWWLAGITAVTVIFTGYRGGLRRGEGIVVMALYLVFVAVVVAA